MKSRAHELTTLAAMDALPVWQQKLWEPERTNLAEEYSLYGDTYALKKESLGPFVELPDGTVPDFYMPKLRWKHHYDAAIDYWEAPFYDKALATFQHFSERISDSLRQEDITSAARFAGTMAHYIQDNSCPGHAVDDTDLEIIKDLLPPPDHLRRLPFHPMMETSPLPFSLDDYAPKLHGSSIAEAASLFVDRLVDINLNARKSVLPFFNAFYSDDQKKVTDLNLAICRFSATVFADYLHTVACIAHERFEDDELRSTAAKNLSKTYPYRQTAWAGGNYGQVAPGELCGVNLGDSYEPVPCELLYQHGKKICTDALGATAYFEYEFKVPNGIYGKFAVDYGIHATLGSRYPITFEVYCNDELLLRDIKNPDEPAGSAEVDWPTDGTTLRLITTVAEHIKVQRINGRPITPTGHAVWASPTLVVK